MPIFEYQCLNCGADFEELTMSSKDSRDCPVCQSHEVVKKLSVFASSGMRSEASGGASSCATSPFS